MKKKTQQLNFFFIIVILTCFVSCQNHTSETKTSQYDTTTSVKKAVAKEPVLGLNCDTTVISQEFSYKTLAFEVFKADTNKIKSLFLDPVVLKMKKATSEDGVSYYLHNFTDGTNSIVLFRNPKEGFYIEDAEIKNNKVLLNKNISIDMEKDTFLKLLNVSNVKCDTITVKDDESSFESIYIFKLNKLIEIKMGQIVE